MSFENSPARRQNTGAASGGAPIAASETTVADDLMVGAEPIARFLYGKAGKKELRDVYRNPFGFSFFKHGNSIAGLKSTIRAELLEAQRAARAEHLQMKEEKEAKARAIAKPRRRRMRIPQPITRTTAAPAK
jgi:hypothetical protein